MKFLKQIILTSVIALFTFTGHAQDGFSAKTKGTFFTNGSINIYNTTRKIGDNNADAFTINVSPKAAYFIMDNLSVGLELTILSNKETQEDAILGDKETTTSGFAIGPFARYYFNNGFFGEALVGLGSQKTTLDGGLLGNNELKSSTFGFRVGAGYAFFWVSMLLLNPQ